MANATIRDLVVGLNPNMKDVVSHLVKKSGFMKVAQAIEANMNIEHEYRRILAVPTFTVGSLDQTLVPSTITRASEKISLAAIDATEEVNFRIGENWAGGQGVKRYFSDNYMAFIEGWSQAAMKQVIYGIDDTFGNPSGFLGLHQLAKQYGNVKQMGGTTGSRSSIFAVKFAPENCGILINPADVKAGTLIKTIPVNDGKPYKVVRNTTTNAQDTVYGVDFRSMLAFLSTSSYDVAAMTQIQDDTGDKPTSSALEEIIDMVQGDADGSTFLFMNRNTYRLVKQLKETKLEMGVFDMNYQTKIDYWNGIPIVIEDNILSTETTVLD